MQNITDGSYQTAHRPNHSAPILLPRQSTPLQSTTAATNLPKLVTPVSLYLVAACDSYGWCRIPVLQYSSSNYYIIIFLTTLSISSISSIYIINSMNKCREMYSNKCNVTKQGTELIMSLNFEVQMAKAVAHICRAHRARLEWYGSILPCHS